MIWTILVAALAACGGILLLRALAEAFFEPLPGKACHIFYLRGEEGPVEQQIRTCLRMREKGRLPGRLIFVDCGLSADAQMTALLMLREQEDWALCGPSQVTDYIEQEKEIIGAGTD